MASVAGPAKGREELLKDSSGEIATALVSWLASPLAWYAGTLLIFAALARWQALQTRRGGVLLMTGLLALLGLVASQAAALEALLVPTRLVVLLFLGINLFALWLAFHERLECEANGDEEALGNGPLVSTAELWLATAAGLGVLAAALVWGVPPTTSGEADFFHGAMQLRGILVPWAADFLMPGLLLATLLTLPWLHRPPGEDTLAEAMPRNAGLIFFGLSWLLLILIPMAVAVFQDLRGPADTGSSADPSGGPPMRTLAQFFWYRAWDMEMPSSWLLRESPGIGLLLLYFALLPFVLPRLRASGGFCRRCHKALGARRYAVLLALLLILSLVPLKMMSHWWFGIGQWIAIPELPFHF